MTNPIIDNNGNKRWYNNEGQCHRIDGPAIECISGHKEWYQNGKRHRVDGPAIEWADGEKDWYQDGIKVNHNIKINHNLCKRCKIKCRDESKLVNIPINCKYELEHVVSNDD